MGGHQTPDPGALKRRDQGAVEEWFLAHADQVYTFAFYRVGNDPEVAADVVQETFLTALDRIDQYEPERGAMSVWLMYLARNCIRAANRHRSRVAADDTIWERIDARLVPSYLDLAVDDLPSDALEKQETVALVQATLANLPESYRWALVEHYFEQRSLAEMTRRCDLTTSGVKSLLFRARAAFKCVFCTIAEELGSVAEAPGRTP
jgi:RNA polymerase sigma-70 factor (ECF subfamily)